MPDFRDRLKNLMKTITGKVKEETDRWELIRIKLPYDDLPKPLKGLHIVHISDLHCGPFLSLDRLKFFTRIANQQQPDLIFVTGDMLHESLDDLPIVIEGLKTLKAKHGVYSVLGNHDHYDDYTKVVEAFKEAGLNLLVEETKVIEVNGEMINIIGIDYPIVGRPVLFNYYEQIVRAKQGSNPDAFNILLAHNPDAFPSAARLGIELTLSGHTHGGQFIMGEVELFGKKMILAPIRVFHEYVKGHYRIDKSHLYVNKGLGHWFPIRINCPSEVTSIKLS
jgi:hypothetical protein